MAWYTGPTKLKMNIILQPAKLNYRVKEPLFDFELYLDAESQDWDEATIANLWAYIDLGLLDNKHVVANKVTDEYIQGRWKVKGEISQSNPRRLIFRFNRGVGTGVEGSPELGKNDLLRFTQKSRGHWLCFWVGVDDAETEQSFGFLFLPELKVT